MKKIVLVFTSVLLLLICMSLPVYAAGVTANVSDKTANRGDTVTITATLSSSISVGSGSISLSYDKNILELTRGTWNVSGAMLTNFDVSKEKGAFAYSAATNISGTIFTATFKVLNTAALGTTDVSLYVTLKDGSNADISVTNNSGSITVACKHNFTKQDASATYLKSNATCTSPAVYYKSCTICGAKGTETFKYGSTLPHTFTEKVSATYLKSDATCTARAVYYKSCSACGTKGTETFETGSTPSHNYKTTWSSNSTSHWHECLKCKDKKDSASHSPGAAATETTAQKCTVCSYVITPALGHKHAYNTEWSNDASNHWHACLRCNEVKDKGAHKYDNACDTTCNTCDYTRQASHNYSTEWSKNKTSHWHECSKCKNKKDTASHSPGAAATETTAQTCTVCSYVITPALGHKHDYNTKWSNDASNHWHACFGCNVSKDKGAHVYDNACDTTCNTCDYRRKTSHNYSTEWSKDKTSHWHECSKCKNKKDTAFHTPGAEATNTTAQTCTVCGYVIKEALGHTHIFSDAWKIDGDKHWHECTCGEKSDEIAHNWDDGVITKEATVDEDGVKTFTCSVCQQKKTASIDKLPQPSDLPESPKSTGTPEPLESTETLEPLESTGTPEPLESPEPPENNTVWIIILVVSVVVIGGGIVVTIIFAKKKKASS